MLPFQDGSTHAWPAGRAPLDPVVTLDDATGAIYAALLVAEEGTWSGCRGLAEVIARHGLFRSLGTDRGRRSFVAPGAGGKVAKDRPTGVGRALRQLGIGPIPSYSPEARGRMERAFGTPQRRLPRGLRLAGITTVEAANRFLAGRFIPAHDRRFAVTAAEPGGAFVPFAGALAASPCVQQAERVVVGHADRVRHAGLGRQIPARAHRHQFVKLTVRVHGYADGGPAVFHGRRRLARYDADGRLGAGEPQGRSPPPKPARRRAPWIRGRRSRVAHNPTGPTAAADI